MTLAGGVLNLTGNTIADTIIILAVIAAGAFVIWVASRS